MYNYIKAQSSKKGTTIVDLVKFTGLSFGGARKLVKELQTKFNIKNIVDVSKGSNLPYIYKLITK